MRLREVGVRDAAVVVLGMTVLAVTFGEFMTGGIVASPFSILGVFAVPPYVVVSLTYGFGVLLVREAYVRWNRGWASLLLLGAADAWVLQGVFTKVLFGPASSPDIAQFGSYGHWIGVNWVLVAVAMYLDGVQATVLPIFLTGELLPRTRGRRLLSDLGLGGAIACFLPLLVWEDIYINADNNVGPSPTHPFVSALTSADWGVLLLVVFGLALLAWKLPSTLFRPRTEVPTGSPWVLAGLGALATISTLAVEGFGWRVVPWAALLLAIYAACLAFLLWGAWRRVGARLNLSHQAALAAGVLSPWLFLDVILEMSGDILVLPIAVSIFVVLAFLWRRGSREALAGPTAPAPLPS